MKKNRRKEDNMHNDDLIKELMTNGNSTKYLVAKMYIEFREDFIRLNGKVNFHDKVVWAIIGILITATVGGAIGALINHLIHLGG